MAFDQNGNWVYSPVDQQTAQGGGVIVDPLTGQPGSVQGQTPPIAPPQQMGMPSPNGMPPLGPSPEQRMAMEQQQPGFLQRMGNTMLPGQPFGQGQQSPEQVQMSRIQALDGIQNGRPGFAQSKTGITGANGGNATDYAQSLLSGQMPPEAQADLLKGMNDYRQNKRGLFRTFKGRMNKVSGKLANSSLSPKKRKKLQGKQTRLSEKASRAAAVAYADRTEGVDLNNPMKAAATTLEKSGLMGKVRKHGKRAKKFAKRQSQRAVNTLMPGQPAQWEE